MGKRKTKTNRKKNRIHRRKTRTKNRIHRRKTKTKNRIHRRKTKTKNRIYRRKTRRRRQRGGSATKAEEEEKAEEKRLEKERKHLGYMLIEIKNYINKYVSNMKNFCDELKIIIPSKDCILHNCLSGFNKIKINDDINFNDTTQDNQDIIINELCSRLDNSNIEEILNCVSTQQCLDIEKYIYDYMIENTTVEELCLKDKLINAVAGGVTLFMYGNKCNEENHKMNILNFIKSHRNNNILHGICGQFLPKVLMSLERIANTYKGELKDRLATMKKFIKSKLEDKEKKIKNQLQKAQAQEAQEEKDA